MRAMLVLTNDFGRGSTWLSDLKKSLFTMDTLLLTLFTDIVVIIDDTLVADTLNRINLATITDDVLVYNAILFSSLVNQVSFEHLFEFLSAVLTNFSFD